MHITLGIITDGLIIMAGNDHMNTYPANLGIALMHPPRIALGTISTGPLSWQAV
jgi:uncharacterized protein (DUF362 family)